MPRFSWLNHALVSYAAIITGAFFLVLSFFQSEHSLLDRIFGELGMVFLAVGLAHLIFDKLLREEVQKDFLVSLKNTVQTAMLHSGLRYIDTERTKSRIYQRWVYNPEIKEISIIGRSVLHSMDKWAHEIFKRPIEEIILKKLKSGGKLTIFFLDPRTSILPQLISEEGPTSTMRHDLRRSLEICANLAKLLQNSTVSHNHSNGSLKIAVYQENSTFAYHKQGDQTIIGFYPLHHKGDSTPNYEVIGKGIGRPFDTHFTKLNDDNPKTTTLIDYEEGRVNNIIGVQIIDTLLKCLPEEAARQAGGR